LFDKLVGGSTIDLAWYEIGNAIWKQVRIQRSLTVKEARMLISTLGQIVDNLAKIKVSFPASALEIAVGHNITFYDASYVEAAIESSSTLVTDDGRLSEVGQKYVHTIETDDI
jgi:predicted nucleic acid-binding protein